MAGKLEMSRRSGRRSCPLVVGAAVGLEAGSVVVAVAGRTAAAVDSQSGKVVAAAPVGRTAEEPVRESPYTDSVEVAVAAGLGTPCTDSAEAAGHILSAVGQSHLVGHIGVGRERYLRRPSMNWSRRTWLSSLKVVCESPKLFAQ